jgi:hypothetical protein
MGQDPYLSHIESPNFFCTYCGPADHAAAVVLNVATGSRSISKGTPLILDMNGGNMPARCLTDGGHNLCSHAGPGDEGFAEVLELAEAILS